MNHLMIQDQKWISFWEYYVLFFRIVSYTY